jgi:hypothetical protein
MTRSGIIGNSILIRLSALCSSSEQAGATVSALLAPPPLSDFSVPVVVSRFVWVLHLRVQFRADEYDGRRGDDDQQQWPARHAQQDVGELAKPL